MTRAWRWGPWGPMGAHGYHGLYPLVMTNIAMV
jgi:hypothetical protein